MRFILSLLLMVVALPAPAQWFSREEAVMGTVVRVELWQEDEAAANAAMTAVMDEMQRIDACMSPFKADSELSRINRDAARAPVTISQEMFDLTGSSKIAWSVRRCFDPISTSIVSSDNTIVKLSRLVTNSPNSATTSMDSSCFLSHTWFVRLYPTQIHITRIIEAA